MTTHARQFREVILETVESRHPALVSLEQLYSAAHARISFDADDAIPPMLHGNRIKEPSWKRNLRNVLQGMKEAGTLVNAERDGWRLPSPNPTTALDESAAWVQVRSAAELARDQEREFRSSQRGQRYRIGAIFDDKITIIRLDSAAPETVSRGEVERAIVRLNAAGGRVGRRTVHYTVAKEVAIVDLHPQLRWDTATDSIVAVGAPAAVPIYCDFGEAPDDDPTQLALFARRVRAGQPKFRKKLLALYDQQCAISGWGPGHVLEAAHIDLHSNSGINQSGNGLLLRSDLHTLFDSGLLRIHPDTLQVVLSEELQSTNYWTFNGTYLRARSDGTQPSREYLRARWRQGAVRGAPN